MLLVTNEDIFGSQYDAIVNPANQNLLAGSGLSGKIHKLAGAELESTCRTFGRQPCGSAIATPSFQLENCSYIIHACGPRWFDGSKNECGMLSLAYHNIVQLSLEMGLSRVAVPAISTGIYRFPQQLSAEVAIDACKGLITNTELTLIFTIPEADKYDIYAQQLHVHLAEQR